MSVMSTQKVTNSSVEHSLARTRPYLRIRSLDPHTDDQSSDIIAITREYPREGQKQFNLPVGPEGEPVDHWLFDPVVEHGYLSERLRLADAQPDHYMRSGTAFVQVGPLCKSDDVYGVLP